MMKVIIVLLLLFSIGSCTSPSDIEIVRRNLEAQGYTNIEMTRYRLFCCSEDDMFKTGFKAISKTGEVVTGCACSGIWKGVTIRFD